MKRVAICVAFFAVVCVAIPVLDEDADEDEVQRCIAVRNQDDFDHCTSEAEKKLPTEESQNSDSGKCLKYGLLAGCFLDRTRERCGEEGMRRMEELYDTEMPEEIREACYRAGLVMDP